MRFKCWGGVAALAGGGVDCRAATPYVLSFVTSAGYRYYYGSTEFTVHTGNRARVPVRA
jgi:hypothetical protein